MQPAVHVMAVYKTTHVGAVAADGQAAQLLAGMLASVIHYRNHLYPQRNPRERDLHHLVDLVLHLCSGKLDRALNMMGMMQYVHVSDCADEWLHEMVPMFGMGDHDIFGEHSKHGNDAVCSCVTLC